ncbi:MAG: radical SAM protein [Porticoccus sp.]|nr:radical SAM protein [Porticoccus sp.]
MITPIFGTKKPLLSKYVHPHKVDDNVVGLYHPFGHEVALVTSDCLQSIENGFFEGIPNDVYTDLVQRRFLVQPGWDDIALDDYAVKPIPGFFSLWLIVAQTCNIGCTYCVVEADTQTDRLPQLPNLAQENKGYMTNEVADRAMEVFQESLARHRQPFAKVTLYGGEPLLNRPLLKYIIPRLRQMSWEGQTHPLEILCFTNGIVYDEKLTEIFLENDVTVGMSLDGPKEINDLVRLDRRGGGTYDKIVRSYHRYRDAGIRVGLSCTLGDHNHGQLVNVVSHFVHDLHAPSVQFQVPIQVEEGSPNYLNMGILARESLEAFELARDAGVEEGLALRRLTSFSAGRFHHRDCAAVGGELAVSPQGIVGPCHNATIGGEEYFKGNVLEPGFNPEVLPGFVEWHARMPVNMSGCHGCSAIGLCGGGCPYNALIASGSIWKKDPQQCGYMNEFLDWLLEDIWARYSGKQRVQTSGSWQKSAVTSSNEVRVSGPQHYSERVSSARTD